MHQENVELYKNVNLVCRENMELYKKVLVGPETRFSYILNKHIY